MYSIEPVITVPKTSQVWCARCSCLVDDGPASEEPIEEKRIPGVWVGSGLRFRVWVQSLAQEILFSRAALSSRLALVVLMLSSRMALAVLMACGFGAPMSSHRMQDPHMRSI